ncbi:hypothetical protein LTR36_004053 [Oleoguttula mirabilis]|uniref:Amino acid permease/ SLC12A domain-containing protein n=1 Tax=Oleoguttula mirabilis TaxID=1507867 RepID=A0AAV9JGJ9_9PEZI|nr:hypothetical protein LTR36_004053 [Oleoguttula mirabilis]
MQSLGEMTTLYPGGGSFISLADRVVDEAFAVPVGWRNYFIIWAAVLANEYNVGSCYIVNLSGVSTFRVWASISLILIRFRAAWHQQGRTRADLPFKSLWHPWNACFGLFANVFLAFVQGWTTLSPFNAGNFVDAYILLPLFPIMYFAYKLIETTHFKRAYEVDLDSTRRLDLDAAGTLAGDSMKPPESV